MCMMAKWEKKSKVRDGHFRIEICRHRKRDAMQTFRLMMNIPVDFLVVPMTGFYHTNWSIVCDSPPDRIDCLLLYLFSPESQHLTHNDRKGRNHSNCYTSHFVRTLEQLAVAKHIHSVCTCSKWGKQFCLNSQLLPHLLHQRRNKD